MTLIDTVPPQTVTSRRPARVYPDGRSVTRAQTGGVRPPRPRPAGTPIRYTGTGVGMSRGPHRRRPVTPGTTAVLAMLAALITAWLGLMAQFGAAAVGNPAPGTEHLGVVRVEPGESLQHLAARVAPDSSAGSVAERIRELNGLESVAVDAGQTLVSPIG